MNIKTVSQQLESVVRDVPDFPKPGIVFKDITPVLKDHKLCNDIADTFATRYKHLNLDAVVGIESRGFLFGMLIANRLNIPFIPIRKAGKLPYNTLQEKYDLEYGNATIEIHEDALKPGSKVVLHDDLLATGGTARAGFKLLQRLEAQVVEFSFLIELEFLGGRNLLPPDTPVFSLLTYQ
ncbi:MAG: adenine phosphoribosyltransferase [Flavobacteriales bacterium]|nr:adenine phosphoribosyltransferase [Flavobacteriales bacterium]